MIVPHAFRCLFFGRAEQQSTPKKKKARNGVSSMGAASRGKELDHRLRIAGSGAKGEKGRGNG